MLRRRAPAGSRASRRRTREGRRRAAWADPERAPESSRARTGRARAAAVRARARTREGAARRRPFVRAQRLLLDFFLAVDFFADDLDDEDFDDDLAELPLFDLALLPEPL